MLSNCLPGELYKSSLYLPDEGRFTQHVETENQINDQ